MPDYRTRAFVLRRTNYGEYDRILNFITEAGKRSILARGVRKERSKLAGGIELFSLTEITAHTGRSGLDRLTSARLVEFYNLILEDHDRLQFAYEVLKHIDKFSDQIDSPDFFDLTLQTISTLGSTSPPDLRLIQTWFYLNLARILGTDLNLLTDTNGMKLIEDGLYTYDTDSESFRPVSSGPITGDHIKFLRLQLTNTLAITAKVKDTARLVPDCLSISRALLKL